MIPRIRTGSVIAAALAAAAALLAGCASPNLRYELRPLQAGRAPGPEVVFPPQIQAKAKPRTLHERLDGSRVCRDLAGGYDGAEFGFSWSLARGDLGVTLGPTLSAITQSVPAELLRGMQGLHTRLDDAVARGCLAPGTERALLLQVADSAPLASDVAQYLVLGPYTTQAYIDVSDPVRLSFTYGLLAGQPGRYDLGYVVRDFRFVPDTPDGRGRLEATRTEVRNAAPRGAPPPPPVQLAQPGARFYRLFFFLRVSERDHGVALLSATSRGRLDAASRTLLLQPQRCLEMTSPDLACTLVEPPLGLDATVFVHVQGKPVLAALPATVNQALQAAGQYHSVPARLRVTRPWKGREIPVQAASQRELLSLQLLGGERIDWR